MTANPSTCGCGASLEPGSRFCPQCGSKVDVPAPGRTEASAKTLRLKAAAGYAALGYGVLQVLVCLVQIVRAGYLMVTKGGFAAPFSMLISGLFLGLGLWIAVLGWQAVRGDRSAVAKASRISLVYLGMAATEFAILGFLLMTAMNLLGPQVGTWVLSELWLAIIFRIVLLAPPLFIVYVEMKHPSKS